VRLDATTTLAYKPLTKQRPAKAAVLLLAAGKRFSPIQATRNAFPYEGQNREQKT
jgi:hypothetical protein